MVRNDALPRIEVNPETYEVRVDGELATVPAGADAAAGAEVLPGMTRAIDVRRCLALLQIGDSPFPSGAFAHSYGLEQLVRERRRAHAGRPASASSRSVLRQTLGDRPMPSRPLRAVGAAQRPTTCGVCDRRRPRAATRTKAASELRAASH